MTNPTGAPVAETYSSVQFESAVYKGKCKFRESSGTAQKSFEILYS